MICRPMFLDDGGFSGESTITCGSRVVSQESGLGINGVMHDEALSDVALYLNV